MNAPPELRRAQAGDLPAIRALLAACGLPGADLDGERMAGFHVATIGDELAAVAGIETAGDAALLRSLAVSPPRRGGGLARRLVCASEALAQSHGVAALYLIANDAAAARFFARLGYAPVERQLVPAELRKLAEFTHLCAPTHPCLRKRLAQPSASSVEGLPMKKLEVFDPAMCCSTGICGVDVDPALVQFAADLKWLEAHGVAVARHNLGQEPQAFVANAAVVKEMEAGLDRLPIVVVDGRVVSTGAYPAREQLAQTLGIVQNRADKLQIRVGSACCAGKTDGC